jgi:alpha-L-fucosidase
VAPFVASVKKVGQAVGMYYSLTNNARTKTCAGNVLPNPAPGQIAVTPEEYDALVKAHLTELWSNYGPLAEVWFVSFTQLLPSVPQTRFLTDTPSFPPQDGGFTPSQRQWVPPLLALLQPHAIAFNGATLSPNPSRWIGSETGYAPNETWSTCDLNADGAGDPNSGFWYPAETDFTVLQGDTWFFDTIHGVRPPAELRAMYEASVGHNTQALIGVGIPPNGTVSGTAQAVALAALGSWVRGCFGAPIAQTSGTGTDFTVMPSAAAAVDRVVMQEDQTTGQRVRAWTLTAFLPDGSTLPLGAGRSIGNKRIVAFPEVPQVTMVELKVTAAVGAPVIANFAIFGGCDDLARRLDAQLEI